MTVYLVGAGPGAPDLLTVRAAELLKRCDVVVHDRLSGNAILDLVPVTAIRVNVGKAPNAVPVSQDEINDLLVAYGRSHQVVVRLKGGDPFVFARGAEEAAALRSEGVPFDVVPGISSALAAPALAGIPVTVRNEVLNFTVVTGHQSDSGISAANWEAIAAVGGTIVILMGAAHIGAIAERLIAGGLPGTTPVASVRWASTPQQDVVRTTLGQAHIAGIRSPATIVVGHVADYDLLAAVASTIH